MAEQSNASRDFGGYTLYLVLPRECVDDFNSKEFVATNLLNGCVIKMDAEGR